MKIQLIYMSAATRPLDYEELLALLMKARLTNDSLDITGMLVYHEDSFLQILEGEETDVEDLYERIHNDPRHTHCALLHRSPISHRSFSDWNMGFLYTGHEELKTIPGFYDFFEENFSRESFLADPTLSRTLLLMFRDGRWHQTISSLAGEPALA